MRFSVHTGGPSGPGGRVRHRAIRRRPGRGAVQAVAPSLGVELSPVDVRDAGEIERAVTAFARGSNGGLIVTGTALAFVHRDLIISLASRHRMPTVYWNRRFVPVAGIIAYGPVPLDPFRRAAGFF